MIATVLIIGFTIVLAALVITWGNKLFQTTVEDTAKSSKFALECTSGYDAIDGVATQAVSGTYYPIIAVKLESKLTKIIPGLVFVARPPSSTTTAVRTFSTDITTVTGATASSLTTGLNPFGAAQYSLSIGPTNTVKYKEVEVNLIVDVDGVKKVCQEGKVFPIA